MHPTGDSQKNLFPEGAYYSVNSSIIPLIAKQGYIEARNMRFAEPGEEAAMYKIRGEDLIYPAIYNQPDGDDSPIGASFQCLWAILVAGHIFEIWADSFFEGETFFRLDGNIVALSADIPFSTSHPIQGDKNDGNNGEVFITDFFSPPHIYSVGDLFSNSGYDPVTGMIDVYEEVTEKYYDDYNPELYVINLALPADHPIFKALHSVSNPPRGATIIGDNSGVKAGSYVYYTRLGDASGNVTNISEGTPAIPVPQSFSSLAGPWGVELKKLGALPGTETSVGVWIKVRVTNLLNYTKLEVIRERFDSPTMPLGGTGIKELIYTTAIAPGEISIRSFFDTTDAGEAITVDSTDQLTVVDRCKTLRYFDSSLYLMNIVFADRAIEDGDLEFIDDPDVIYPVTRFIGNSGHYDPYNAVYYRSYMYTERYGFGLGFRGAFGEKIFAKSIPGTSTLYPNLGQFANLKMPSRRDEAELDSVIDLGNGAITTTSEYAEGYTFEASIPDTDLNPVIKEDIDSAFTIQKNHYSVLHPIDEQDNNSDHDFRVNIATLDNPSSGSANFNVASWSNKYYSLGVRFGGLAAYPSFVAAFTVLNTKPAGRVVVQGIGCYSLNPASPGTSYKATKELDTLWFWSPDIAAGLIDARDIIANPENYEVQIVSAFGFHSEVYNGIQSGDLVSYARIHREFYDVATTPPSNFNFGDTQNNMGDPSGYVSQRKWRNNNYSTEWDGLEKGNKIWQIENFTLKESTEPSPNIRSTFYNLKLTENVYSQDSTAGDQEFGDTGVKEFHEPIYIVNILRKGAQVDTSTNQQSFLSTPAYVKITSIVARQGDYPLNEDGLYKYELVDERWEDCIVTAFEEKFIWIRDANGNEKPWFNVHNLNYVQIAAIFDSFLLNGYYDTPFGVRVYGTYDQDQDADTHTYYLIFGDLHYEPSLIEFQVPADDTLIVVKYDNNYPVDVHGGECFNADSLACFVDGKYVLLDLGDLYNFELGFGMPYYSLTYAANYDVFDGNFTGTTQFDFLRQWVMMACITSRMMMNWNFNGSAADDTTTLFAYPKVHYMMRPLTDYDANDTIEENDVDAQFAVDYPDCVDSESKFTDEVLFGGFRFYMGLDALNLQYSQRNPTVNIERPRVGFVENNEFETGILWSRQRDIGVQDAPNLKSFPATNFRAIADKTGGIMKAFSALSGAGNNLYAFTENGICLLLTNKFIVQGAAGEAAFISEGEGETSIQQETWLNESVGIPEEFWRTFAEEANQAFFLNRMSAWKFFDNKANDIGKEYYHSRIYQDMIRLVKPGFYDFMTAHYNRYNDEYWVLWRQQTVKLNSDENYVLAPEFTINPHDPFEPGISSVFDSLFYEVVGGSSNIILLPKAATKILSVIIRDTSSLAATITVKDGDTSVNVTSGTLAAGQSKKYVRESKDDPWVASNLDTEPLSMLQKFLFVYHDSDGKGSWVGRFDYFHDRFVAKYNQNFGMRSGATYTLGEVGHVVDGENLQAELMYPVMGEDIYQSKNFFYIRINTQKSLGVGGRVVNSPPTSAEFYDNISQERQGVVQTYITEFNNRYGFESYIPRRVRVVNNVDVFNGDRMQGNVLICKIIENDDDDFAITSVEVWFKLLK